MLTVPKSEKFLVLAVCTCLILCAVSQVCFASAQNKLLIGKEPPKLAVSEWVKGNATTLEELKGKVVLLYFWAAADTASSEKFADLIRFHRKYARDGLVIIAIHDSSIDKESLNEQGRKIKLSDVLFRVAIDSPAAESSDTQVESKGKTTTAYGATKLPAQVLIGPDGKVQSYGVELPEKRINLLLYGHTRNLNTEPASPDEALSRARKELMTIVIGAMVLILVGVFVVVRRRFGSF